MEDKNQRLLALAKKRQQSRWSGYNNIGDYHNGIYECDYVSPWSKSAHNENAEVMVFLQDWMSDDIISGPIDDDSVSIGYASWVDSNKNLKNLLGEHLKLTVAETYTTNLFPFIKKGSKSSRIPQKDMVAAAREFGLPQIQMVQPRIVIALGIQTFNALRVACRFPETEDIAKAINSSFLYGSAKRWCQTHPSQQAQNTRNRGRSDQVSRDWKLMAHDLAKLRSNN